jgi:putative tricarboxylic transport membrane protein
MREPDAMPSQFMRNGEIIAGLALAALGSYVATASLKWEIMGRSGPGPGFFPLGYGVLMVVLSLVLVIRAVLGRGPKAGEVAPVDWRGVAVALTLWAGFAATIPLMKYLGFFVTFALLMFFVGRVIFARPVPHVLAGAVGAPLIFFAVFSYGLQLRLPVGSLTGF